MSATFTRFEVLLPLFADGTPQSDAVNTFKSNLLTLNGFVAYDAYFNNGINVQQVHIVYGLIAAGQQTTALGYLTTLNTALGSNVVCLINSVTSEP